MNRRFYNKTFVRFFVGFVAVLGVAFGVLMYAGSQTPDQPRPIDNVAVPR